MSLPRNCTKCGVLVTPLRWEQMTYKGIQRVAGDSPLELRNCECGSTLAEPVTESRRKFLRARGWLLAACLEAPLARHINAALSCDAVCDPVAIAWLDARARMGNDYAATVLDELRARKLVPTEAA